ncbi:calmodulin-related [Lithospermum erythrorhizon]|uniref:Calmodulin-related n=1 Tax=Lithospermum erythrorhizon TaxID=34254 RepID=A0AAV3PPJ9_LITER
MNKYIKALQKKLKKLNKTRSISRSNDPSFSSTTSSDSSELSHKPSGSRTPTSVLPNEIEWVENYITNNFVQAFQMMDQDGDGKIKKDELQILLSKVSGQTLTENEIKSMLTEVDQDGDGCISLEELKIIGSALEPPTCDNELRETFDFFDEDHNGKISAEELYNVLKTIVGEGGCSLDECRKMIKGVDRNGDGFVCFEDFCRMMDQQLIH